MSGPLEAAPPDGPYQMDPRTRMKVYNALIALRTAVTSDARRPAGLSGPGAWSAGVEER
jgi:hypothetical protein